MIKLHLNCFVQLCLYLHKSHSGAALGFLSVLWIYEQSQDKDSSITGFLGAFAVGVVVSIPCAVIGGIIGLFI
jgi:hypothetical protein